MNITFERVSDVDKALAWRREIIGVVFETDADTTLTRANRDYLASHLADGSHAAFAVFCDGVEAGCGSICFQSELPSPENPSGRCAYLMNIYVREQMRGHGVGRAIVRRLVDESYERGCGKIYLETTDLGRPLYSAAGFHPMKDMMEL